MGAKPELAGISPPDSQVNLSAAPPRTWSCVQNGLAGRTEADAHDVRNFESRPWANADTPKRVYETASNTPKQIRFIKNEHATLATVVNPRMVSL
jgi:hypothetical protein